MIFGKLFSVAVLSSWTEDDDAADDGSEGTRFIGLCDLVESRTPHRVVVDEDDEELPHSVDVDEEEDEIVDRRSLFAEFGRFKLRLDIRDVILSLFTELGRDDTKFFRPEPQRSMEDRSLPLPPPPLVVRNSSYGDSSPAAPEVTFNDNWRFSRSSDF